MRRASNWSVAALVLSVPLALAGAPAWAGTQAGAGTHGWASATWADLWQTPDQQAQRLMSAGKAAEAARRFKDERQRAYAELEAGQYANAAKHLAPFKDADSQYNRGNALARSGDLKSALSAYDQALASKPGDKDVQHNRDLVAQALQRQQQQHNGKNGSQGKDGNQGKDSNQGKGGSGQDKQDGQNQAGQERQQQSGNESGQQASAQNQQQDTGRQSSAQNQQTTAGQRSNAQNQQMNPGQQNGQDGNGGNQAQQRGQQQAQNQPDAIRASQGNKPGNEQETERQAQEAAKQDVAQANATQSSVKPHGDALQLARQTGAQQDAEKRPPPPTEQSLTLEQWLRRIPDDPGELLRRKFLVEHMQKQAGSQ
jgi:Ca-activated chloride channel homolog